MGRHRSRHSRLKKINRIKNIIKLINFVQYDISLNERIRKKIDIELTVQTLEYTKLTNNKIN